VITAVNRSLMARMLLTLAGGGAGGALFWYLHLPAPWLSGAMIGLVCVIAAGVQPYMPLMLRDLGMLFAGAVTGSAITPEMIETASRYPVSLGVLVLTTVAVVIAGRATLTHGFGWDRETAFFASVPGALSAVFAAAGERDVDMLKIAMVQSFRIFVLIALLPSTVVLSVHEVTLPAVATLHPPGFALMMAAAFVASLAFERWGLMAPFLLGGMVGAATLHVSGLVVGTPPGIIAAIAMLLVGIFAGSRFASLDFAALRALALPGISVFLVTSGVAALGALVTATLVGLPIAIVLVAYAPGGLEAMIMLGLALGLDPLYVSAHHIARFVMIAATIPMIARRMPPNFN
jgi:uncharacterized protein